MNIIKSTYPDIHIEIYDKDKLKKSNILDIDKQLNIHIEDYVLNYKTGKLYIDFLKDINVNELIVKNIIEKKNLQKLAKQYNVPYPVMCRAFYMIVPKLGTDEFYSFCFHKFYTMDQIKIIKKSFNIKEAVKQIENGLKYKRNYEIIRRFRKGILCH